MQEMLLGKDPLKYDEENKYFINKKSQNENISIPNIPNDFSIQFR